MIKVTRLNSTVIAINPDYIEYMEETPDLVITFESGRKVAIRENIDQVINAILHFRQSSFKPILKKQ